MLIVICTQIFLNMPRIVAEDAGTAGWILALYVSIIAVGLFVIMSLFYKNFEGKDLLDIAHETFGRIGRVVVGIIIVIYLIVITSVVLRGFSENMKIISLNLSPISYVIFFFTVSMAVGAYMGIEAIIRVAAIIVPVIIAGYIIIAMGVLPYTQLSRIAPWLGAGPYAIFVKGLTRVSIYSEGLFIALIAPFLKTNKNFRSVGYTGFLLSAIFITLSSIIYLLIYQYPLATENFLPMYQLARLIYFGRFFERIESLFLVIWAMTAFLYLAFGLFFSVYVFQKTMELKYYQPLIFPFLIIIFSMSILPPNLITVIKIETEYIRKFSFILTYALTIVLLAIATIVKKRRLPGKVKSK
jgi:spore germination protein (amino acid permease)